MIFQKDVAARALAGANNPKPRISGADKHAVDSKPGRVARGFEICGGVIQFHAPPMAAVA